MKITLITQDEPFFLSENIKFLIKHLPIGIEISSCIITKASPFGKRKSFLGKILETYKIFGLRFFIY